VLKFPDKPFEINMDASDFAIGGVLMQDGCPLLMRARSSMVIKEDGQLMKMSSLS
jgi:hypothetical protein